MTLHRGDSRPAGMNVGEAVTEVLRLLEQEEFESLAARMDPMVRPFVSADVLRTGWEDLIERFGPIKSTSEVKVQEISEVKVAEMTCEAEKGSYLLTIAFSPSGKIVSLRARPPAQYWPPKYGLGDVIQLIEMSVGAEGWPLPGVLGLPKRKRRGAKRPPPVVVMVHGSGPNDRDETVGPNKPFLDLALGLAGRGVATLRYDKRTLVHGARMAASGDVTVREEVIDDALSAVAALRRRFEIDRERIFLLGHSLGAHLAPSIGSIDHGIAGLIVMAGPSRPFEEVLVDQFEYLKEVSGGSAEQLDEIKKRVALLKSPEFSLATPPDELPLGLPPSYWLSLTEHDPWETSLRAPQPMLVIQGERDYQVTMEDFEGWQKIAASRPGMVLRSYPTLNHLFMEGAGKSVPSEYDEHRNVAPEVIEDIAGWVEVSVA